MSRPIASTRSQSRERPSRSCRRRQTEGNPLFLEELARAVGDRTDDSSTLSMPDTVQGVLQARIDRLADAPKRLLQTASVIGREVPLKLLRAVWETPGSFDVHLLDLKSVIGREVPLKLLRAVWQTPGSFDVHLLDLKRQEFLFERSTAGEQTRHAASAAWSALPLGAADPLVFCLLSPQRVPLPATLYRRRLLPQRHVCILRRLCANCIRRLVPAYGLLRRGWWRRNGGGAMAARAACGSWCFWPTLHWSRITAPYGER